MKERKRNRSQNGTQMMEGLEEREGERQSEGK